MALSDLVEAQASARDAVRLRVEAVVLRSWAGLGSWSGDDVEDFLRVVVPIIEAGQVQTAAITEAYLAAVLSDLTGSQIAALGAAGDARGLRPVGPEEVYKRPFVEVWTALKAGKDITEATRLGSDRLGRLVEDDLSLAHRRSSMTVLSNTDNVTGFRRVIRPERARSGTCGLCMVASDQRYKTDRLMPIHTRCHCEVMPIVRSRSGTVSDPGHTLNREDLDSIYSSAGSTESRRLKEVRVTVSEHGELGPVLRRTGQGFTGPGSIAA